MQNKTNDLIHSHLKRIGNNQQILNWIASVDGVSPEIVESFCENKITGAQLLALGKEGLDDLGVKQKGVLYLLLKVSWCLNFTTRVLAYQCLTCAFTLKGNKRSRTKQLSGHFH